MRTLIREIGKNHFEVKVYAGIDPVTGKERRVSRTVHGGIRKAKEKERELLAELKAKKPIARVSVSQLLEHWLATVTLEDSTRYQMRRIIETKINPRIGGTSLRKLYPATLDGFYGALLRSGGATGGPLAASTVRRVHSLLHAALEYAVAWEWIERNPANRAHPPVPRAGRPTAPDPNEVRLLLKHAETEDPDLYVFLRILVATGMRRGEASALRWNQIDNGAVRKVGAIGQAKGLPYLKGTKTGAESTVSIDTQTQAVLAVYRASKEAIAVQLDTELHPNAFVFSNSEDGSVPIRPGVFTNRFVKLRDSLGLDTKLRNLRHFHATQLLEAGTSLTTVSQRLAHAKRSTTLNFYAGWLPSSDRQAAETIAKVLDG